jgi:rare lipoprotein A (peptidoglycan hydrolase)
MDMKQPILASPAPPGIPAAIAAAIASLLLIAAPTNPVAAQSAAQAGVPYETGLASWYGVPFHGRLTASGERYDMEAMTAAHKTLPFGSLVLVRCLDTGLSVEVRINDRGPFVAGRIIDLSAAAGRALGLESRGLARVELRVLSWPLGAPPATAGAPPPGLRVQLASYASERRAADFAAAVGGSGLAAAVERAASGHYRVVLPARDRSHAAELLAAARARGFSDAFVKEGE